MWITETSKIAKNELFLINQKLGVTLKLSTLPAIGARCLIKHNRTVDQSVRLFLSGGELSDAQSFIYHANLEMAGDGEELIDQGKVVGIQRDETTSVVFVESMSEDGLIVDTYVVAHE